MEDWIGEIKGEFGGWVIGLEVWVRLEDGFLGEFFSYLTKGWTWKHTKQKNWIGRDNNALVNTPITCTNLELFKGVTSRVGPQI